MRKLVRFITLLAVLALFAVAIGVVSAQEGLQVLRVEAGESDVPTLDPSLATDSSSIQVLNETYIGLTHLDEETLEPMPGMATAWEVTNNDDGTVTYTFTLRNDVPWVRYNAETGAVEQILDDAGNPRMVTAGDFVYGWTRTLDPRTAADYAYVLSPQVVGGNEFNSQTVADDGSLALGPETLAISAPDDFTFVVTAPVFYAFQPSVYGMWIARPQLQSVIEEFAEFWIEDENFVAYGPFAVKEWLHDESLTLIKNPFWPGNEVAPQSTIDEVVFLFLDASTALAEYEAGNIDVVDDVAISEIPRIKADPVLGAEYFEGASGCTYYFGMSVGVAPFDNVHMRRAFSYAIDRLDIIENVLRNGSTEAPFFANPTLLAAPLVSDYPELGIRFDPEMAQAELALALADMGYSDVSELPPITYLFNTSEAHQRIAEAAAQMWEEHLGITVQLTNQEFGVYLDTRGTFPIWRAGWCQDFPDAHNFLFDVFHSSSNNNDTGWSNETFDALVEEASTLTDVAARTELYAQAEQILSVDEAAIVPIYFYSDTELTKPYVERTYSRGTDQRFENWTINR